MGIQKRKLLYESEYFPHYYLCNYVPKYYHSDLLSQSLIHFKNGSSPHHQAWVECAFEELKKVRELKFCHVIRALGHNERVIEANAKQPINKLTAQLSNAVQGTSLINFLEKVRTTCKLSTSQFTKEQRDDELYNVYQFNSPGRSAKHILIIDDILTTGSTMRAIIAAVLKACPSITISVFTLAHTHYSPEVNANIKLSGKNYSWAHHEGWMLAEEDSPEYARKLSKLKQLIMTDSFP